MNMRQLAIARMLWKKLTSGDGMLASDDAGFIYNIFTNWSTRDLSPAQNHRLNGLHAQFFGQIHEPQPFMQGLGQVRKTTEEVVEKHEHRLSALDHSVRKLFARTDDLEQKDATSGDVEAHLERRIAKLEKSLADDNHYWQGLLVRGIDARLVALESASNAQADH